MAGITSAGFDIKTAEAIQSDMEAKQLAGISPSLDLQPTGLIGVLNGIVTQACYEVWQLGGALYNGMSRDAAAGDQLASLALLTGTKKLDAVKTRVKSCTVNVDPGTYAAGTLHAHVVGNALSEFVNAADVTNSGGSAANKTVDFVAVNAGAVQCLASTLTVIAQAVSGWNSITNPTDGIIGSAIESDPALRARSESELSAGGSTSADAIRSDVLRLMQPPTTTTVTTSCRVLYNDTDVTDANGTPAHTIEVIARQPGATADDDLALATLIAGDKAAGIATTGGAYKDITDSQGNVVRTYYTRPTDTDLYIEITVAVDANLYPADGDAQVAAALAAFGDANYGAGDAVYVRKLGDAAFGVAGVKDITAFKIDDHSSPTNTANIAISFRNVAALDTSRIVVTRA